MNEETLSLLGQKIASQIFQVNSDAFAVVVSFSYPVHYDYAIDGEITKKRRSAWQNCVKGTNSRAFNCFIDQERKHLNRGRRLLGKGSDAVQIVTLLLSKLMAWYC